MSRYRGTFSRIRTAVRERTINAVYNARIITVSIYDRGDLNIIYVFFYSHRFVSYTIILYTAADNNNNLFYRNRVRIVCLTRSTTKKKIITVPIIIFIIIISCAKDYHTSERIFFYLWYLRTTTLLINQLTMIFIICLKSIENHLSLFID